MRSRKFSSYPKQAGVNHMMAFLESWDEPRTDTQLADDTTPSDKPVGDGANVVQEIT